MSAPLPQTPQRPRTRAECIDGPRPCPWVSCRHHLALTVTRRQSVPKITLHLPEDPADWPADAPTCSLDVADSGEHTLDTVGQILGVSRERVRQVESHALARLAAYGIVLDLAEDEGINTSARWIYPPDSNRTRLDRRAPKILADDPPSRRTDLVTPPPKDHEARFDYVHFRDEIRDKAAILQAAPPTPIRTIPPTADIIASLEADLAHKRTISPAPQKRPPDFRPSKPPRNQRPSTTADAPTSAASPPSPPSPAPTIEPPASIHTSDIPQPEAAPVAAPVTPSPTEPPMMMHPHPTRPTVKESQARREAALRASHVLERIMGERGVTRRDLAMRLRARCPGVTVSAIETAVSRLLNAAKPATHYWRLAADALGISLADLDPDPVWQAGVLTAAPAPALDTSELDPREFFAPASASPAATDHAEPPRGLEIRALDALTDLRDVLRQADQRITTLTRERDEALAALAKIRAALGVAA